jgi:signal transduction histidine kinase/DNA-binding response OmpR family regulator
MNRNKTALVICFALSTVFIQPKAVMAQPASPGLGDNVLSLSDTNRFGNAYLYKMAGWRYSPEKPGRIVDGKSLTVADTVRLDKMNDIRKRVDWRRYAWFENEIFVDSAVARRGWTLNYFSPAAFRCWLNGVPVVQSGRPSEHAEDEELARFVSIVGGPIPLRPGKNTLLIEISEHTLNLRWPGNMPFVPTHILDVNLVKPQQTKHLRLRTFVFGGALMLLLSLLITQGFLALRFRHSYHKYVAFTTFFMLLYAFTTMSDTVIFWTWAYAGFHEWVNALAFLFVVYFYLIAVRRIYDLPVHWTGLTLALATSVSACLYALYFHYPLLDTFHPVLAVATLVYGVYSLYEAKKSNPAHTISAVLAGLLISVGGAIAYVLMYVALGYIQDFVFVTSVLMVFSGIPMSLTYNIAYNYAGLVSSLEQKVAERTEALQASKAELEKAGEYKSRFFANISHEFRTPLTIASGLVDRVAQKTGEAPSIQQDIVPIKRSLKRLSDMVNQLVDLTKADHNQMTLHPRNLYGDAVVSIAVESFRSLAEHRNQDFVFQPGAPGVIVYADRSKLEIMVNNLISNAIKYTQKGGRIVVETRLQEQCYGVVVADNGKGIPQNEQEAIFERFHRIKQMPEGYVEGMGIGLELSRSLARMHGGDISLDKTYTEGACFRLSLPVSTVKETVQTDESYVMPVESDPAETATASSSFSILLVEDNDDMAQYVGSVLKTAGNITRTSNGAEALRQLSEKAYDLVLTDLMMPEMDGMELVRAMQRSRELRKIPVVVLTARALDQDKLDLLRIGVVDYIVKPFLVDELLLKTRSLLQFAANRQKAEILLSPVELNLQEEGLASKAAGFVQQHVKDPTLSIDLVADHFGISRRTFYRIIEVETGMTPAEFIREVRLQLAHNLALNKSVWTLDTLAAEVGYSSGRNFKKLYQDRFGAAPL